MVAPRRAAKNRFQGRSASVGYDLSDKTVRALYVRNIKAVREKYRVGTKISADLLYTDFPSDFPRDKPHLVGTFLKEAQRRAHLDHEGRLAVWQADPEGTTETVVKPPSASNSGNGNGGAIIMVEDYPRLGEHLLTNGEAIPARYRFRAGWIRETKPVFKEYDTSSIGNLLAHLLGKSNSILLRNGDGTYSLSPTGLQRQKSMRKPVVTPEIRPTAPARPAAKATVASVTSPTAAGALSSTVLASLPAKPALPPAVSVQKPASAVAWVKSDPRIERTAGKFVKLLRICERLGISVISGSNIGRLFREFGEYASENSLLTTIYLQAQAGRIFEQITVGSGGYRFRADYAQDVRAGRYGAVVEANVEIEAGNSAEVTADVSEASASSEQAAPLSLSGDAEPVVVEPVELAPEPAAVEESAVDEPAPAEFPEEDEEDDLEGDEPPEASVEPALPAPAEGQATVPLAEPFEVMPALPSAARASVTKRVGRAVSAGPRPMQEDDAMAQTLQQLQEMSNLVRGFPGEMRAAVDAALQRHTDVFQQQFEAAEARHLEQMEVLRRQAEDYRRQLLTERILHARDVESFQGSLEELRTLGLSFEGFRLLLRQLDRRLNLVEGLATDFGTLEDKVSGLEEDLALATGLKDLIMRFRDLMSIVK